ncbi:MAG: phosphoribosylformylglycinamidine cyclo-ligase [Alphaproteobacteria bacterium]|nr:phosphoribosylformylglycinamidine cyclo-ligase [Alphaproteobacteria bacterium]
MKNNEKKYTYKDAGVDIDAGNTLVERIKPLAKSTERQGSMSGLGGFGAFFDIGALNMKDPLLVSATDGVGTKLKIAIQTENHKNVGIDLVGMCVNDILCQGAEPLFFLDYFATGGLELDIAESVISGIAEGCKQSGCALIGGETAEMPGMYTKGDYDLAGFSVGAVERDATLPKLEDIKAGDILIGVPSNGLHSNGFSLVRKVTEENGFSYNEPAPFDKSVTLGDALLAPTRLYIKGVLPAIKSNLIKAAAHITGGGITENLPRVLPENVSSEIDTTSWNIPPVFMWLAEQGNITEDEMLKTFNCGVGLILAVSPENEREVLRILKENGETPFTIGHLTEKKDAGDSSVVYI